MAQQVPVFLNSPTSSQFPESPCPTVFQYQSHVVPGDTSVTVSGLVTVTSHFFGSVLLLFVHLQLRAVLPSKYVGLIELIDKDKLQEDRLSVYRYRVRFPLARPIPTVRQITLNSQVICSAPPVRGSVVTDIRLEHTLKLLPPPQPTLPSLPLPASPNLYHIDPGGECGVSVGLNPLIVGGRVLKRGEWPWLAAIFILNSLGLQFHCSGSIITKSFILTVGHCIKEQEAGSLKPEDVVVYLGKFNLQQWEEPHSVIKEVKSLYLHPEFDETTYTADLALVELKTPVQYNVFIQPVCLWSQHTELELIVGLTGTVVGWGKDNVASRMSPIPRILQIPIVSTEECIRSHSQFYYLTSNTTLCAGAKNGTGPCNGDSGGGLMLPVTQDNVTRWELRGLVSLSLLNTTSDSCDLDQYFIFTDIAKFLDWISSVVITP